MDARIRVENNEALTEMAGDSRMFAGHFRVVSRALKSIILLLRVSRFSSSCSALTKRKPSRSTKWLRWKELVKRIMAAL